MVYADIRGRGFLGEVASNDSGVVDDDIFGYFGRNFF